MGSLSKLLRSSIFSFFFTFIFNPKIQGACPAAGSGITADGTTQTETGCTITVSTVNGATAINAGTVNLSNSTITATGTTNIYGGFANGAGTNINFDTVTVSTSSNGGVGVFASNSATGGFNLDDVDITTSGSAAHGVQLTHSLGTFTTGSITVSGVGSNGVHMLSTADTLTMSQVEVDVNGVDGVGLKMALGGNSATLSGCNFTTTANGGKGVDLGTIGSGAVSTASLTSCDFSIAQGVGAVAFGAVGIQEGCSASLTGCTINTEIYGLRTAGTATGSSISGSNTAVNLNALSTDVYGAYAQNGTTISLTNLSSINTSGAANSHAFVIENNATGNVTDSAIDTSGTTSHGLFLSGTNPTANCISSLATITTSGSSSNGVHILASTADLTMENNDIVVNGANSIGIKMGLGNNVGSLTDCTITTTANGAIGVEVGGMGSGAGSSLSLTTSNVDVVQGVGSPSFGAVVSRENSAISLDGCLITSQVHGLRTTGTVPGASITGDNTVISIAALSTDVYGAYAQNGTTITLQNNSTISTTGAANSHGFVIEGSTGNLSNSIIETAGNTSHGLFLSGTSPVSTYNTGNITTSGTSANGVHILGSTANLTMDDVDIEIQGGSGIGLQMGLGNNVATLTNSTITTTEAGARGVDVGSLGSGVGSNASLDTCTVTVRRGIGTIGFGAVIAREDSSIVLDGCTVNTEVHGLRTTGVVGGASITAGNTDIILNSFDTDVYGAYAQNSTTITLENGSTVVTDGQTSAHGFVVENGSTGNVSASNITTLTNTSHALFLSGTSPVGNYNAGNITTSGASADGVRVLGSTANLSMDNVTILINGASGAGLQMGLGANVAALTDCGITTVSNGARGVDVGGIGSGAGSTATLDTCTINVPQGVGAVAFGAVGSRGGSSVSLDTCSVTTEIYGLRASGSGTQITSDDTSVTVTTLTADVYGAYAQSGSTITLQNGSSITTSGAASSHGFLVENGSTGNISASNLTTSATTSHGLFLSGGSSIGNYNSGTITVSGSSSDGVRILGSTGDLSMDDVDVFVNGVSGAGLQIGLGANEATLANCNITTSANGDRGVDVGGIGTGAGSTASLDTCAINVPQGVGAVAFAAVGAREDSSVDLTSSSVTTQIYGLRTAGTVPGALITADDTDIAVATLTANVYGAYAQNGTTITLQNGSSITTSGAASSHGFVVENASTGNISASSLTTSATTSHGLFLSGGSSIGNYNSGTITVSGSSSDGVRILGSTGDLSMDDVDVFVNGASGAGLQIGLGANEATLTNCNITTSANGDRGVDVGGIGTGAGSTASLDTCAITVPQGVGAVAFAAVGAREDSSVDLTSSSVTTEIYGLRTAGTVAGSSITADDTDIAVTSLTANVYGAYVQNGTTITLQNNSSITTSGAASSHGFVVEDASTGNISASTLTTNATTSHGLFLSGGSGIGNYNSGTITVSGSSSDGVRIFGSAADLSMDDVDVFVNGASSAGLQIGLGANEATLANCNITTSANGDRGVDVGGIGTGAGSTVSLDTCAINVPQGVGAVAFAAVGAREDSSVDLTNSSVTTEIYGLRTAGTVGGATITADNTDITVSTLTANVYGAFAEEGTLITLQNGSSITTSGATGANGFFIEGSGAGIVNSSSISTSGASANGIVLSTGSDAAVAAVVGSTVSTSGSSSSAIFSTASPTFINSLEAEDSTFSALNANLITIGSGQTGLEFTDVTAEASGSNLLLLVNNTGRVDWGAQSSTLSGDMQVIAGCIGNVILNESHWTGASIDLTNLAVFDATWTMTDDSTVTNQVLNGGVIDYISEGNNFKNLEVSGAYVGDAGIVGLNTFLGGDGSPSDLLIINGGSASGTSLLNIKNTTGMGAQTFGNGILVVEAANGGTTGANSFSLAHPVMAGPYQYQLFRGDLSSNGPEDWYLRTASIGPQPDFRQEASLYAALPAMTLLYGRALLDTLQQRVGEEELLRYNYTNCDGPLNFFWTRVINQGGDSENGGIYEDGPDFDYQFWAFEMGLDVFRREYLNGNRDHIGVIGAIGGATGEVNHYTGRRAGRNKFNVYSGGAYWTHFGNSGWYIDAVFLSNWYQDIFARSILNLQLTTQAQGLSGSIETGIPFRLNRFIIEPEIQLVYQSITIDDSQDQAAFVDFNRIQSLAGRVGLSFANAWRYGYLCDTPRLITAWLRFNYWHDFKGETNTLFSSADGLVDFPTEIEKTWIQGDLGFSAPITNSLIFYGSFGCNVYKSFRGQAYTAIAGIRSVF